MPSEYYNRHAEELIKLAEYFEKSKHEFMRFRAGRIRALIKRESEKE